MKRKIRDKLSKKFKSMNYPEQKRYIRERIKPEPLEPPTKSF